MKKRYSLALSCILASVMYAGCDNGSGIKVDVDECTGEGCGSTEPVAKTCTGGKQWCESDKECFDLKNDKNHCGKCDIQCKGDQICKAGECSDPQPDNSCNAHEELCSDGCRNLNNDSKNCGTCGNDCNKNTRPGDPQKVCVDKTCELRCADDQIICDGNCVNPKTDKAFCGAQNGCSGENAGEVCGADFDCQNSQCVCNDSTKSKCMHADGWICTDPKSDNTYCGCSESNSGMDCSSLANIESGSCDADVCTFTCDTAHDDCNHDVSDGCEADLNDIDNCGACGHICSTDNATSASCVDGACKIICNPDAKLFNEKCIVLDSDNENCGWLGNACNENQICRNGLCTLKDSVTCDARDFIETKIGKATVKAYCIDSYEKLAAMRDAINQGKKYPSVENVDNAYILMNDIEFTEDAEWMTIGIENLENDEQYPFSGKFLGNGKTIRGKIRFPSRKHFGLFGIVNNSEIYDLAIDLENVSQNDYYHFGILAGYINESKIANIKVSGNLTCEGYPCGGLFGVANHTNINNIDADIILNAMSAQQPHGGMIGEATDVSIENADMRIRMINQPRAMYRGGLIGKVPENTNYSITISNTAITGTLEYHTSITNNSDRLGEYIGGMIGDMDGSGHIIKDSKVEVDLLLAGHYNGGVVGEANGVQIENTTVTGKTQCSWQCGGLAGALSNSTVSNAKVIADVESVNWFGTDWRNGVGGLVGNAQNSTHIKNSLFDGHLTSAFAQAGGIAGSSAEGTIIENCQVKGTITGAGSSVGGIVGSNSGEIRASVNQAEILGSDATGGIAGSNSANISNSVSVGNVTCKAENPNACGGLTGSSSNGSITACASFGDVNGTGKGVGAGFIGSSWGDKISYVYSSGKVNSFEKVGKFAGNYRKDYVNTGSVDNSYYWSESASSNSVVGDDGSIGSGIEEFTFEANIPVLSDGKKLADMLGEDWVDVKCDLKSGPGKSNPGEYTIPVPKGVADLVCK